MSQEVQGMLIRLEATTAQLRQEMARADATVAQVSGRIDRQLSTVDAAFTRAGQSALSAGNMLRNAMGAAAAGMSISSLVAQADAYASIASRLRLVTSTAAEFTAAQKAVFSIAQESYQPLTATAELYQRIATNQKELRLTGEGVAGVVGTISKTLAISGASASSANAALIQLGQAFASGVLRGEELNSVMEQAPALAQAIAAGMGKTVGQLRTLGADGKLTADAVVKALQKQQKAVEELYGKTAVTVGNSITAMGNSYTQLIGRIDQAGNASARVASVIVDLSKAIDTLTSDSAATERSFVRVSSVAETLAVIIGGRLALAAGQMVIGFAAATKASIQQAISLATSTSATLKQAEADAAAARQAVITAKSRQTDAQAMLARASAEILAAEQKVAADRIRQTSEINNLKYVQATLAGERALEEQRLAAQITEQGRAAARSRMAEARLAEVAIIRQIQEAEIQLAATTSAASVEIQAAYAARSAAAAGVAETTLAANAAIRASDAATAATSSASKAMLLTAAAGRGLMALLTGPVGLIAMTAAVAYSFFNVGSSADSATSSLIEHNATVEESISQYKALSAEQQRLQKITWAEQQIEALDAASSALDDYTYKIERAINLGPFKAEFRGMIDDVEAGRRTLDSVTTWIEKNTKLTPAFGKELAVLASEFQKNTKAADDFGKKINGIDSASSKAAASTDQLKTAQAASGQTQASKDAWDKYIEQLTKARDLLGANTAAEAAYTAAKMGATPAQAAQAKIIAEQTDVLKKYQDAVKDGDKAKQASLKAELTALYTAEDAAKTAAAVQSKAYADTATAAENSSRRQITAIEQAANFAITSATRVATGAQAPQLNLTGYGLLTNGGTAPAAPVVAQKTAEERAEAAMAQIVAGTTPNKEKKSDGEKLIEKQRKALEEFTKTATIALKATKDLAAAYLSGSDSVRDITIKQEIENEVLKVGEQARKKVTDAINAQHDAQDRLDISKKVNELRTEVEWLKKEAVATLAGEKAIDAFNVAKAVQAEIIGKKIDVGSEEYKQLVAMTKAQLDANKALAAASKANDIVDRLNPQIKLLKDYTAEQEALTQAMELYPEKADLYREALTKLGNEYEVNRSKATIWGQMTEAAVDRIDGVFADAWANIGDGAGNLWDNLKKGFKQTLGEIAHMLTTKPLLASFANWLTGTDNGQGIGSVWGKLLGTVSGSGESNGGFGMGSLVSIGKTLYQTYSTLTGVGSSAAAGYATGGVGGALSGIASYYSSMLGSFVGTLSSGFSSIVATITGATAAQTAAVVAAEGVTTATLSVGLEAAGAAYASQFGAVTGAVSYAAAESAAAASASAGMSSMMGPLAVIIGMYQSGKLYDAGVRYDTSDMQTSKLSQVGRALPGMVGTDRALAFAAIGLADRTASALFGGKAGAILSGSTFAMAIETFIGQKLFGTDWATKDAGIAMSVDGGRFTPEDFQYQKKKGGLFGSNKKRTLYAEMQDKDMADSLGEAYNSTVAGVLSLFNTLKVSFNEGVLDGLNVARLNISTQDRTTEEIQADITKWFTDLSNAAVGAVATATGEASLADYTMSQLQSSVDTLFQLNAALEKTNNGMLKVTVGGLHLGERLAELSGGIEKFQEGFSAYYQGFISEAERADDVLIDVGRQFLALNVEIPATRDGFKKMVEAIDLSTLSGQDLYIALMKLASGADAAYKVIESREAAYYSAFHSESENTQRTISETTAQIKSLGVALPATRAEFRAMVEAASKDTSVAGQALYSTLLRVAGSAGTIFDALESTAQTAAQTITDALLGTVTSNKSALERAINAEKKSLANAYNARTTSINDMLSTSQEGVSGLKTITNALDAALKSLRSTSDDAVQMLRSQAKATVASALAIARAGGSLSNFEGLDDALSVISSNDTNLYSSLEDFNREQGRNANLVAELNGLTGKQLTSAEKTVKALQDQLKLEQKAYEDQVAGLDAELEFAQQQIDVLNGVDTSVKSVAEAVRDMQAALIAAFTGSAASPASNSALIDSIYKLVLGNTADKAGKDYWMGQVNTGAVGRDQLQTAITNAAAENAIKSAYDKYLGHGADAAGQAYWAGQISSGALTVDQLQTAIKNAAIANGSIQAHASGGRITGAGTGTSDSILSWLSNGEYVLKASAVRMFGVDQLDQMNAGKMPGFAAGGAIGETGPVLQITRPAQIYASQNQAQASQSASNAELLAELRAVRGELVKIQAETQAGALAGNKVARVLDRVTDGGNAMLTKEMA